MTVHEAKRRALKDCMVTKERYIVALIQVVVEYEAFLPKSFVNQVHRDYKKYHVANDGAGS